MLLTEKKDFFGIHIHLSIFVYKTLLGNDLNQSGKDQTALHRGPSHASRCARFAGLVVCDPPSAPAGSIETMLMLAGWSPVEVECGADPPPPLTPAPNTHPPTHPPHPMIAVRLLSKPGRTADQYLAPASSAASADPDLDIDRVLQIWLPEQKFAIKNG
jgi:hypothetical protein